MFKALNNREYCGRHPEESIGPVFLSSRFPSSTNTILGHKAGISRIIHLDSQIITASSDSLVKVLILWSGTELTGLAGFSAEAVENHPVCSRPDFRPGCGAFAKASGNLRGWRDTFTQYQYELATGEETLRTRPYWSPI